jgi:quinol monooxygenase YgiN
MIIKVVHIHVKPEDVEAFAAASLQNASNSVREQGVARFDVIQEDQDPNRFVLYEAYYSAEAVASHTETAHYHAWRAAVADMMAEPRRAVTYVSRFPEGADW